MRTIPIKVAMLLASLIVLGGIAYLTFMLLRPTADGRSLVLHVGSALQLGDGTAEVRDAIDKSQLRSRTFHVDGFEAVVVETPLRFGATNWCLLVLTETQEGKVVGLGYRTADSLKRRPKDANTDRVADAVIPVWKKHFDAD